MPLELGTLLNGRYRIEEVLGQGGFGAVYAALDEALGLRCAVKENLSTSPQAERQFRREATLLAGLRHPNLPRVTHHFLLAGHQYLVMDFVEGQDLRQRLEADGALPPSDAVRWVVQLCDALVYLHGQKPAVIHRDIKPANIKITPEGMAVLVDFGIAKVAESGQKTTTGAAALTSGYAPPEQYQLGATDGRTDEYALAATLYHLVTGRVPPDSVERLIGQAQLVAPETLRPDLAENVTGALRRGLEIRPDARFESVGDFRAALLDAEFRYTGAPEPAAPAPPPVFEAAPAETAEALAAPTQARPRRRWQTAAAVLLTLCMLIVLGYLALGVLWVVVGPYTLNNWALQQVGWPTGRPLRAAQVSPVTPYPTSSPYASLTPVPPTATPTPTVTATATPTASLTPTMRPFGLDSIGRAHVLARWGEAQVYRAEASALTARRYEWSSDGRYLAAISADAVNFFDGDMLRPVRTLQNVRFWSFGSPDQVLVSQDRTLLVIEIATGATLRTLVEPVGFEGLAFALSPDNQIVVVAGGAPPFSRPDSLSFWFLAEDRLEIVDSGDGFYTGVNQLRFTPDGQLLVVAFAGDTIGLEVFPNRRYTGAVSIRKLPSGAKLRADIQYAHNLQLSFDGQFLSYTVLNGRYESAHLEDLVTGGQRDTAASPFQGGDLSPTGRRRVETANGLRLIDPATGWLVRTDYFAMALAPDGRTAALAHLDGIDFCDVETGQITAQWEAFEGAAYIRALQYVGGQLVIEKWSELEVWDVAARRRVQRVALPGQVQPQADGSLYSSRTEALGRRPVYSAEHNWYATAPYRLRDCVISPDGRLFAVQADRQIVVYSLESGQPAGRLEIPSDVRAARAPVELAFAPDSQSLAVTRRATVELFDVKTWRRTAKFYSGLRPAQALGPLYFLDGGARLAAAAGPVWDVKTGVVLALLDGATGDPLAVSPDDQLAVDAAGQVWDLRFGTRAGQLAVAGRPLDFAFTADGRRLVWQTADGVLEIWGLTPP